MPLASRLFLRLAFSDRVVEAHEPVLVQASRPELAVEGLDERIVCRLAGRLNAAKSRILVMTALAAGVPVNQALFDAF